MSSRRLLPDFKDVPLVVILAAVYVAAGRFGLSLAFDNPSASPVWPPTGIAIAALLSIGTRMWPAVALGAFIVNFTTTGLVAASFGVAAGNTLEAVLAAQLAMRFANGRWAFESTRHMLRFIALVGLLSTMASPTVGVISLSLGGQIAAGRLGATWLTWWLGDAVAALIVAPFVLLWYTRPAVRPTWRQVGEGFLWLGLLVGGSLGLYGAIFSAEHKHYLWPFVVIPLLICVSIRFGRRAAVTGVVLVSGIATWGTLHGFGPFALPTPNESLLTLQAFMGLTSVLTLTPAVMTAERRSVEARMRAVFNQAVVGIADCDLDCCFLRVNQRLCDMLGYTREELFQRTLIDITHPEDRAMTRAGFERLKVDGVPNSADKRYVRSDGTTVWVRAVASRVVPGPGQNPFATVVVENITPRKQAEDALQRATTLEERNRLAGEIHDNLSQSFVGIILQLENAAELLPTEGTVREHVDRATHLARSALKHARRSLQDLRPSALEVNDLPRALHAAGVALLAGTGVELDFRCDGAVRRLAPEIEEQLFYIGKEALANAWKHASARTLSCRMRYDADELRLEVVDDGRGFAMGQVSDRNGFGLAIMRERAQRIGANLSIQSDPGRSTSVVVSLPLRPA